jgi:hypothetical protein
MLMVTVVIITVVFVVIISISPDMSIIFLLLILLSDSRTGGSAVLGASHLVWHRDVGGGGGSLEAGVGEVGEWRRWCCDDRCGRGARRRGDGCCRCRGGSCSVVGMGSHQARVGRLAVGEIG